MSAPIIPPFQPVKVGPIQPPIKKLHNDFEDEGNDKASKIVKTADGRELKVTVFFPPNCTDAQRNLRLMHFTDANLLAICNQARLLGLGTAGKKGIVDSVEFKRDDKGKLIEVVKHFGQHKSTILNEDYFSNKLKNLKAADPKHKKISKNYKIFKDIKNTWDVVLNPVQQNVPQQNPPKKPVNPNVNQPQKGSSEPDDDLADLHNDVEEAIDEEVEKDKVEKDGEVKDEAFYQNRLNELKSENKQKREQQKLDQENLKHSNLEAVE